jgi:low affinity Fe/Cu permease
LIALSWCSQCQPPLPDPSGVAGRQASAYKSNGGTATGPLFNYSDTWQLIINTSTTIVTFLMVFLIQNTQNRDGAAIQVKLDELIRVSTGKNIFVGIEHLSEPEIQRLRELIERRVRSQHGKALSDAQPINT